MKLNKKNITILSFIIFAASCLLFFLLIPNNQLKELFNSDLLYGSSLFNDIKSGFNLSGWSTPPSPYIFPDLIILFPLLLITQSAVVSTVLYGVIQGTLILFFANKILERFNVKNLYLFNLAFAAIILLSGVRFELYQIFMLLLVPTIHTGGVILSLACTYLLLRYFKEQNNKILIAIILVGIFGMLSDLLFGVFFIAPCALVLIIFRKDFPKIPIKKLMIVGGIGIALAGGLYVFSKLNRGIGFISTGLADRIIPRATLYFRDLLVEPALQLTVLLGIISIVSSIYILRKFKNREFKIYALLNLFQVLVLFVAPILLGYYIDVTNIRYFFFLAVGGLINLFLIGSLTKVVTQKLMLIVCVILFAITFISPFKFRRSVLDFQNYYPTHIECIDQVAKENNLKNGLGNYWYAKNTTMFSKEGLRVNQLSETDFTYYHWIDNKNWLKDKNGNTLKYDFILTANLNQNLLKVVYGEPDLIKDCGETLVYIYNNPVDVKLQ